MNFYSCDWKYKAEGNKHVVVSNGKGKCLRLIKTSQTLNEIASKCQNSTTTVVTKNELVNNEKSDEIKFIEHVVMPLVKNCDAFHVPQLEKLPVNFLRELDQLIKSNRPHHRKHQSLNFYAPGLVMQDYCFISETSYLKRLLKAGFILKEDAFSVEIKLKNGFLRGYNSTVNKTLDCSNCVCQFCKTQMYRVLHEKRYQFCSLYCPLDLFSGDEIRVKRALYSLLLVPQNNFRLFKNGELLYSQEVLNALLKDSCSAELRAGLLQFDRTCLKNLFNKLLISKESNGIDPDVLVNLLLKSLLTPILPPTCTELPNAEFCQGVYFKEKFSQTSLKKQNFNDMSSEKVVLPSNCILGIILSQQQMDAYTLSDIHSKCKLLDLFVRNHPYLKDELEVDSPYDSIGWKNFLSDARKLNSSTLDEMHKVSDQLRQFFIAKSFNDCSVMISLNEISKMPVNYLMELENLKNQSFPTARFNIITDGFGNYYVMSMAVVDTDPKYSSNISTYEKKYMQISKWWDQMIQNPC